MYRFLDTPPQIPDSKIPSVQIPGYSLQIPDSEFPSFRGPLLGPVWRYTQIPDSEFPSFRGAPLLGPRPRDPQIPVSEFPSFRGPLFGPRQMESQIPDSEFPSFRGPLLGRRTQQEGPTNSLIKFPSVIPSAHQRWEHRFRNTERSTAVSISAPVLSCSRLYSCNTVILPAVVSQTLTQAVGEELSWHVLSRIGRPASAVPLVAC